MLLEKKNNKFSSILKYTFLYFEYLPKSKTVIIVSKKYLQIWKRRFFSLISSKKRFFNTILLKTIISAYYLNIYFFVKVYTSIFYKFLFLHWNAKITKNL